MPELEPVVGDRPDADALELHDRVPNGIEHLAHLTVAALVYDERQDALRSGFGFVHAPEAHFGFRRPAAIDRDAAGEAIERMRIRHTADPDLVLARDAVAWMREAGCQVAVARQQQQPFRIEVEPANRINVVVHATLGEQVNHGRTVLGIRTARDVAARLVEDDVEVALGPREAAAIDLDFVGRGIGLGPQLGDGLAVDRHAALRDEGFRRPPRGDAGGGENLLQADWHSWLLECRSLSVVQSVSRDRSRAKDPQLSSRRAPS